MSFFILTPIGSSLLVLKVRNTCVSILPGSCVHNSINVNTSDHI